MDDFNSLTVLKVIYKNIKTLIIIGVVAGGLAFGGSFMLRDKYKSLAVVYPINMYPNSDESNSEQLLQYFLSEDVKYKLAKEFNLYDRYGVDTFQMKEGKALFNFAYQSNFKVSSTLSEAIELTVIDIDPMLAQKFNIYWSKFTNQLIRENKQATMRQYVVNARRILNDDSKEIDSLNQKIKEIKKEYDIVDEDLQAKYISKEMAKGSPLSEKMTKQATGLKEKGSDIGVLKGKIKTTLKAMAEMKELNYKYLLDSQGDVNFVLSVSSPSKPDKKFYPVRGLISLAASLSAMFLYIIILLIKNRIKNSV